MVVYKYEIKSKVTGKVLDTILDTDSLEEIFKEHVHYYEEEIEVEEISIR